MGPEFKISRLGYNDLHTIHQTFLRAFSDYLVKFNLSRTDFEKRFVEKLQMVFKHSAGAWLNGDMIGFVFTSIDDYLGVKTAYNGGTGVVPECRGQGITSRLYRYLIPRFLEMGIERCLLEVITTNDRAIGAYEQLGFEKTRVLKCYKMVQPIRTGSVACRIGSVTRPSWLKYDPLKDFEASFLDINIKVNRNLRNEKVMECWYEDQFAGYTIYQPSTGRVSQLAVRKDLRGKGLGKELIGKVQAESADRTVTVINVPETESTNLALSKMGFKNQLDQYEMGLKISHWSKSSDLDFKSGHRLSRPDRSPGRRP